MLKTEHIQILNHGVEEWNEWRRKNPRVTPELCDANLRDEDLRGVDFSGANLRAADLTNADISDADFIRADLTAAFLKNASCKATDLSDAILASSQLEDSDLSNAILIRANLSGADLGKSLLTGAILIDANLTRANLNHANLRGANLRDANLRFAHLGRADLSNADLESAELMEADLNSADLSNANLKKVSLFRANLTDAILKGVDLNQARFGWTVLGNNDLSVALGLSKTEHTGPSTIGIDTLYRSGGRIPDSFLRDCGVPENFIPYIPSLVLAEQVIQFDSCFISYNHKDGDFAKRLHSRLRDAHIRVWFAPEDTKGGQKLHEQIERAIQIHDRLLIVLSENSLESEWVMTEIRKARETELRENRRKLFPIRLVNYAALRSWKCFDADTGKDLAIEVREYYIPDFSNWKDHDAFELSFERLLRDLRTAETTEEL